MIIIDTNVLISGLLTNNPQAPTARIVDAMINGQCRCLLSPDLLDEYQAVLVRPAIARLHRLTTAELDELLTRIVQHSMWKEPQPSLRKAPDPGDNHLWTLLDAEPTAQLVTGDRRLLDNPIEDGRVITPAVYVSFQGG